MRSRAILVFIILFTGIFSGLNMSNGADSSSNPLQIPLDGDWIIHSGEVITLEGQDVEIKGNLTVESGASLTLRKGSVLTINASYDGEYGITVESGGTLNVIDSKVTGLERDYRGRIDYELDRGMNFISIPFERDNNSVESVLSPVNGSYYKVIVSDVSDSSDPWKAYVPVNMSDYADFREELPLYTWNITASPNTTDSTPPSVLFTIPSNGSVSEANQTVFCVFNESMDTSTVPTIRQTQGILVGDFQFQGWRSTFLDNDTAVWTHEDWFPSDSGTIEIYGYRDLSGNWGNMSSFSFSIADSDSPFVNHTVPSDGEEGVGADTEFRVLFDNSMDTTIIPEIGDLCGNETWNFLGWASTNKTDDTAIWSHSQWDSGSKHIVKIWNYSDENSKDGPDHYVFFTVEDTEPPVVKELSPSEGSFSVNPSSEVRVVFSESMNESALPTIIQSEGKDPGNWTFLGWSSTYTDSDTAIWSHDAWDDMENLTLEISNYSDIAGNRGPIRSWSFRTGDHRLPQVVEVEPAVHEAPPDSQIKVVFDSSMNTNMIPDIRDNAGTNYTFYRWESTHFPGDTAVWDHEPWPAETNISISVSNYSDLSEIDPVDGIMLYMKRSASVEISGKVNAYPSRHLYEGWNALGYPFLDPVEADSIFSSIQGDYDAVKTYNSSGEEVFLNGTDDMIPGKAYWIHMTDEALWSVSAYSLSDLENLFPRFGWVYQNGSSGNIQRSLIAGCGYESEMAGGLSVHSDLVKIGRSEFRNGFYGIYVRAASPIISQNSIHDVHYAIVSEKASPILSHNTIFSNTEGGIISREGYPIIASNEILSNEGNGISLYDSTAILDSNTITGNREAGIYIDNSSAIISSHIIRKNNIGISGEMANISLSSSTFSGNFAGLSASESVLNMSSNDFSMETYDVILSNGSTGNIVGNTMSSSERAHILCESGSTPFIYGNILISGDTGIYVSEASPEIDNNIISQNTGSGIQVQNSAGLNISSNTISGNGWAAVYLDNSAANIVENELSTNDFGVAAFDSEPYMLNNTISSNRWYGASFIYSRALIEGNHFVKNQWYGILSSYSSCEMRNSSINNSTYHLYLTHNSRFYSVNSSIQEEKVHLDFTSVLYVKYFLTVFVEDSLGNPVNAATYTVQDRNGMEISSGETYYGRSKPIALTSHIRTSMGVSDALNPYTLYVSWNGMENTSSFYMNDTLIQSVIFTPLEYSVEEDSGTTAIFDTADWFPHFDNSTFVVDQAPGVYCTVENGTVYVTPDKDWNGIAEIRIRLVSNNSADEEFNGSANLTVLWEYRLLLSVIGVDDSPEIIGESPVYTEGKYTVFSLVYRDAENEAPEYVRVVVDGKEYDMHPEDMEDTDYVDGRSYICRIGLSSGEHSYYFSVSDGTNEVKTQKMTVDVKHTIPFATYTMYFLLVAGVAMVFFVAYRIRKLKKKSVPEDEETESLSRPPLFVTGPALDKRKAMQHADSGFGHPASEGAAAQLSSPSAIDPVREEHAEEDEGLSASRTESSSEESPDQPIGVPVLPVEEKASGDESGAAKPEKELKYGRKKYLEMTRKHRKMRVLVEDREKYKIPQSEIEPDTDSDLTEEGVDDILRSLKGD